MSLDTLDWYPIDVGIVTNHDVLKFGVLERAVLFEDVHWAFIPIEF
jgi:hypothetical protein